MSTILNYNVDCIPYDQTTTLANLQLCIKYGNVSRKKPINKQLQIDESVINSKSIECILYPTLKMLQHVSSIYKSDNYY